MKKVKIAKVKIAKVKIRRIKLKKMIALPKMKKILKEMKKKNLKPRLLEKWYGNGKGLMMLKLFGIDKKKI